MLAMSMRSREKPRLAIVRGPSLYAPKNSTLELVQQLECSKAADETRAHMVQLHIDAVMNDELELLAEHALQMNVEMTEAAVFGPASRGDAKSAVEAAMSIMRRRLAKLLRDHQRNVEDE